MRSVYVYRMKEEKTIFKPLLSCHFINSMRTQIYGVQLIHRENNALGSLQLPHTLHYLAAFPAWLVLVV